jgi:NAD(P)-dependent dehydrogenase (short-subunit alcohol dehydrogenase family)
MNFFDLKGKTAIVTGGNQGIGFAIARGLASAGATVVIANRRSSEGERAAKVLEGEDVKEKSLFRPFLQPFSVSF